MDEPTYDLIVRAGRVFCADVGLDGPGAVAVSGDRIVAAGSEVGGTAARTLEFPDGVLLPGLVDLHTHPAPSDWKYGIDPDVEILPRGATTILSQGDCGADDWPFYRDSIIHGSKTRVRLAMSVARGGERDPGKAAFGNVDDLDVDAGVAAIEDGGGVDLGSVGERRIDVLWRFRSQGGRSAHFGYRGEDEQANIVWEPLGAV